MAFNACRQAVLCSGWCKCVECSPWGRVLPLWWTSVVSQLLVYLRVLPKVAGIACTVQFFNSEVFYYVVMESLWRLHLRLVSPRRPDRSISISHFSAYRKYLGILLLVLWCDKNKIKRLYCSANEFQKSEQSLLRWYVVTTNLQRNNFTATYIHTYICTNFLFQFTGRLMTRHNSILFLLLHARVVQQQHERLETRMG